MKKILNRAVSSTFVLMSLIILIFCLPFLIVAAFSILGICAFGELALAE